MTQMISWEQKLYSKISVSEKYGILEKMRLEFDILYKENREKYEKFRSMLKPDTWEALEENWTLWNPAPKTHVDWIGEGQLKCVLRSTHPLYKECVALDFTSCQYDLHGSPDFAKVTFPGSVVDISDLYDCLPVDNIQKRGGSAYSLQEIAQGRMIEKLSDAIHKWAAANQCEPDFWKWRDAFDLVPHEDTDCQTMRLVYRSAHLAFKHRGGVANAVNIKTHFPS